MQLTPDQKKAVEYNAGPLLIIAGAGTGKTTVLVEKITYLIEKKIAKPHEIVALTFTDKAAREMEERVDKALPYGYFQMEIATFHSFCDSVLRNEIMHIGLSSGYKLHTQAQSVMYLKKNLFLFNLKYFRPLGNPNKFVEGLLQHFSRLRDEDISPKEYLKWVKKKKPSVSLRAKRGNLNGIATSQAPRDDVQNDKIEQEKYLELANAYQLFEKIKIKDNILDFSDIIYYTTKLFKDRPNILKQYRQQYKYILVDEFQDTNIAQYNLIKQLAPPRGNSNLTVIGDDNQSIYKFRGASISNILAFMSDYKKAKNVVLTENFRSNQAILDTAYKLIKHNDPDTLESRLGISKNLKSMAHMSPKDAVEFHLSDRVEQEADWVRKEIMRLKKSHEWRDFAILVRANNHAEPFARALSQGGIPYQFLGPGALFKQPAIKDLISYLFFISDLSDSASLYRFLATDFYDIDEKDLSVILAFTKKTSLTLFEAIEAHMSNINTELHQEKYDQYKDHLFKIKTDSTNKIGKIYSHILKSLHAIKKETAGQILYTYLQDSGYLADLMDHTTEKKEKIALYLSRFFDILKSFESDQEDASVQTFVDYLTMSMELKESPASEITSTQDEDAVTILTAHAAKGLEFPVVFVVNLTSDRFPTRERREQIPIPDSIIKEDLPVGDYHIEEERRLFYVALTRAKDHLRLTSSNFYGMGKRQKKLSPFVYESLGMELMEKIIASKKESKLQLSIFESPYGLFGKHKELKTNSSTKPQEVFSYSQLETYKLCPLRYKYQYVLKIPTTANAASSFGSTIHQTLQLFYERHRASLKPDLDDLLAIYKTAWIPIGYTSKTYEKKMKQQGIDFLTNFYKTFHTKKIKTLDLEQWFKIKLTKDIYINGKIDRVDQTISGGVDIIDYKTGKKPTPLELKKSLQMGIYALAAQDKASYGKKISDITLTFYFLQHNEKISMQKTAQELEKVKNEIVETVEEIRDSHFEPKVGPWCNFCPFKINCEAWQ